MGTLGNTAAIGWIPLLPLIGFMINGVWYGFFQTKPGAHRAGSTVPGIIATLAIFGSFLVSLQLFSRLLGMNGESRYLEQTVFSWVQAGGLNLDIAFRMDSLNVLFSLVITGVGTLIHLYSIGYMSHDETPGKFFCYLNLFCFAMLMLVLGSSLPILFFGWEGVGLCSYLLIGYWYTDEEKAKAGKKAFVVNRIGDFGFLIGMFLIFWSFGTLDFAALKGLIHGADPGLMTAIALCLFVGCCGKSAQFPLYIWLPDAMAGPTPVSALIHAATMVTSGIYMVSRLNFIYSASPTAMAVVAVVGAFTAFFAATIAFAQRDIKKVLAYSTVSQLGYMFLACGVGAYVAGVFHVITHAFFKALLFLGAGSVIHGMHEEQDIMKMGGLRSKMPITFATFMIGWLAICGLPPFSGFFSKDEILWKAFSSDHGSIWIWALGAITAVMTAFYMTRLVALTFWGKPRFNEAELGAHEHSDHHGDDDAHGHGHAHAPAGVHESPWTMWLPLVILAILSAVGGFMGVPEILGGHTIPNWLEHWLEPIMAAPGEHAEAAAHHANHALELGLMGVSVAGAIIGILLSKSIYNSKRGLATAEELAAKNQSLHKTLENKWYVDEIFTNIFVKPIHSLSVFLWRGFDVAVIDRVVMGFGRVSLWTGQVVRVLQTGSVQIYAFMMFMGVIASVGYLIYGMVR